MATASAAIAPAAYRQSIASYVVSIVVHPTAGRLWSLRVSRCSAALDPEVGGLDAQRGVVADHRGRAEVGLADRGADDAVVGHRRVEAVLDEQVASDVVDLDLQGAVPLPVGHGRGERTAVPDAQFLERAQRGASGAADVVGPGLETVELLDDRERHDHVGVLELEDARRVGDQHRRVEHEPRALLGDRRRCGTPFQCHGAGRTRCEVVGRLASRRKKVGQRHSSADGSAVVRRLDVGRVRNGLCW